MMQPLKCLSNSPSIEQSTEAILPRVGSSWISSFARTSSETMNGSLSPSCASSLTRLNGSPPLILSFRAVCRLVLAGKELPPLMTDADPRSMPSCRLNDEALPSFNRSMRLLQEQGRVRSSQNNHLAGRTAARSLQTGSAEMTRKILIAAVAVLLPTAAPAQPAPAAEKSSDEIRCDLGGDCNGAERTRSFSVMKRNSTQFSPALPAIPRRAPGAQPAPSHLVRPAPQPGPGRQAVPIRGSSSLSINFQSGAAHLTEDGR